MLALSSKFPRTSKSYCFVAAAGRLCDKGFDVFLGMMDDVCVSMIDDVDVWVSLNDDVDV